MGLVKICTKLLEAAAALMLLVLTAMVFVNVILRYFLNSGITLTEELGRFLFVWIVFAGAILAAGTDSHVKVDILTDHLPAGLRKYVLAFGDLVMIFLCYMIAVGGWQQAMVNMDNISPLSKIPLAWLYLAGAIAGVVIGLILIARFFSRIAGRYPPPSKLSEAEEVALAARVSAAEAAIVAEEKGHE